MLKKEDFLKKYWDYYISIEEDVINTEKYITFDKRNYNVFSTEFIKLYLNICSEIDVVCKLITNGKDMNNHKSKLLEDNFFCKIKDEIVILNRYRDTNIKLKPFENLSENGGLKWWGHYNSIKHNRVVNDNFINSNLENVLTALAALYILELYYYQNNYFKSSEDDSVPVRKSKLFKTEKLKDNVIEGLSGLVMYSVEPGYLN